MFRKYIQIVLVLEKLDIDSGKYVILLDGDDYLYKNGVLEKLDKKLNNQDIVFVKYKQILGEEEQIYKSNHFCCTLKCFKNKLSKDIRYKNKSYHEDISFTLKLMSKAKTQLYFNEILYVHQQ